MATTSPIPSSSSNTSSQSAANFSSITTGDFTKIIINELQKQDPLKPNDTNTLVQELSTLRNIQSSDDLSTKLGQMVTQNELTSAASMIGKTISGLDDGNNRVTGVVKSVSQTSTGSVLNLQDGSRVAFSKVDQLNQTTTP